MKNDTELLASRVTEQTMRIRVKQKERYRLAKQLGFSASEAAILQNWREERIRGLAKSKTNEIQKTAA
jgi:hypothetical protein